MELSQLGFLFVKPSPLPFCVQMTVSGSSPSLTGLLGEPPLALLRTGPVMSRENTATVRARSHAVLDCRPASFHPLHFRTKHCRLIEQCLGQVCHLQLHSKVLACKNALEFSKNEKLNHMQNLYEPKILLHI